jgi:hypothetical protein
MLRSSTVPLVASLFSDKSKPGQRDTKKSTVGTQFQQSLG